MKEDGAWRRPDWGLCPRAGVGEGTGDQEAPAASSLRPTTTI